MSGAPYPMLLASGGRVHIVLALAAMSPSCFIQLVFSGKPLAGLACMCEPALSGLHLQIELANERWQVGDWSCHSPSLPPFEQLHLTSSLYVHVWWSLKTQCLRQRARGDDKVPSYVIEFMKKLLISYL